MLLDSYIKGRQTECWPSQETLARQMGCSTKTVGRAAASLLEAGYITLSRRRNQANRYQINEAAVVSGLDIMSDPDLAGAVLDRTPCPVQPDTMSDPDSLDQTLCPSGSDFMSSPTGHNVPRYPSGNPQETLMSSSTRVDETPCPIQTGPAGSVEPEDNEALGDIAAIQRAIANAGGLPLSRVPHTAARSLLLAVRRAEWPEGAGERPDAVGAILAASEVVRTKGWGKGRRTTQVCDSIRGLAVKCIEHGEMPEVRADDAKPEPAGGLKRIEGW